MDIGVSISLSPKPETRGLGFGFSFRVLGVFRVPSAPKGLKSNCQDRGSKCCDDLALVLSPKGAQLCASMLGSTRARLCEKGSTKVLWVREPQVFGS